MKHEELPVVAVVRERPLLFRNGSVRLFGMLHEPRAAKRSVGMVLSHPFGEEKLWSHRVFVSLARSMAARGFAVLRFDYQGCGDSDGDIALTNIESHAADLRCAMDTLRQNVPHAKDIGLMGLRLGASVAARLVSSGLVEAFGGPLILCEPIVDGEAYIQELLRINLSTQLAVLGEIRADREKLLAQIHAGQRVEVDGYELGETLIRSVSVKDLIGASSGQFRGQALVIQLVSSEKQKDRPELQVLSDNFNAGAVLRVTEQPFWRETRQFCGRAPLLENAILNWLEVSSG